MLRRSIARLPLICVAPLVLMLSACTGGDADVDSGGGQGFVAGDGSAQVIAAADRVAAPELAGQTLTGAELSLADYADEVVVLNLWASWCGPCRAEAPALQEVYSQFRNQGVAFIGLNSKDQDAAAAAFEANYGITYPSLVDDTGELQLAFYDSVPATSIPWTLVIDRDGLIAARVLGPSTYTELSELVDQVASER